MDVVLRYQGWGQPMFDAADVALRDSGHLELEDLSVRIFGTRRAVRWADVAAGRYDAELRVQAQRAVAYKAPVLVSFSQDPRPLARPRGAGSARAYRAAYRHVRAVFDAAGATNAVWVWWVRGEVDHSAQESALWPGTDVVDWIAYSPIEDSACTGTAERTPAQTFTPWYDWITNQAWAAGKPIALAAYATPSTRRRTTTAASRHTPPAAAPASSAGSEGPASSRTASAGRPNATTTSTAASTTTGPNDRTPSRRRIWLMPRDASVIMAALHPTAAPTMPKRGTRS